MPRRPGIVRQMEAERGRLERLALRVELSDRQADRLAFLAYAAQHRGFRLHATRAVARARARASLAPRIGKAPAL